MSVPTWSGGDSHEVKLLESIVYDCLELSDARDYKTIVFPPLGSERFGMPIELVAHTLIDTVKRYLCDNCSTCNLGQFVICIDSEVDLNTYLKELSSGLGSLTTYPKKGISSSISVLISSIQYILIVLRLHYNVDFDWICDVSFHHRKFLNYKTVEHILTLHFRFHVVSHHSQEFAGQF